VPILQKFTVYPYKKLLVIIFYAALCALWAREMKKNKKNIDQYIFTTALCALCARPLDNFKFSGSL